MQRLSYINLNVHIDYKNKTPYEQLYYRNYFLDIFDLDEFKDHLIDDAIEKLHKDIRETSRDSSDFVELLNRDTIYFLNDDEIGNKKYNYEREIMGLKLLFCYDTLDHLILYLYNLFYEKEEIWQQNKDKLLENIKNTL